MIRPRVGLLFLLFLVLAQPFLCLASPENAGSQNDVWAQAQQALAAGDQAETLRLLRICSFSGDKIVEAEQYLKAILASDSIDLLEKFRQGSISEIEHDKLLANYEEICGLTLASAEDWKILVKAGSTLKDESRFAGIGEKFLDRLRQGLRISFDADWVEPLKKLSLLMKNEWQIVYKWQVYRILASLPETAEKYKIELENAAILAQTRARAVISLAEVAMSVGDLESARRHLDQVRYFNREFPELDKMYAKLKRVGEIQKLLMQAQQAMQKRDFKNAQIFCEKVLKIDGNNLFARDLLLGIEEAKAHKPGTALSAADRQALRVRRLEADLKKAEKSQDILQMRNIVKEILLVVSDVSYIKRLEELEREIQASRINAEERFIEAKKLFAAGEYEKLSFFLNRNPGLMSSMERMIEILEMKLMVDFYNGDKGPIELTNAAESILQKGGKSFYASYVLMKIALSDNKIEKAREHYKNAQAIDPDFPGLRWPGWLIWMHGEGRFFVVIVLIIVLVLLIKLIRPVFAWYESTYWTRARILSAIFPSLALRSLEKCFGYVSGGYERRELFGLLVKCCEKTGKTSKGLQYAENLLEISPGDEIAVNMIGRHLIRQPEVNPDKMPLLLRFAINCKDDAKVLEKTGSFIKRSNVVKPEHLDFLRLYVQKFPEDKDMFALIGKSLLEIPASELPDSAISMLETAWKATESDELWWNLWRALMVNGKFELALHITEEALSRGKPISADKLLDVFDREQMAEAQAQIDLLNSFDQKVTINAAKSLLMIKYVCQDAGQAILQTLDRLLHEENPDLSGAARQAYDYVKARVQTTENARVKLLSVSSAPAIDRARLSDEQMTAKENFESYEDSSVPSEGVDQSSEIGAPEPLDFEGQTESFSEPAATVFPSQPAEESSLSESDESAEEDTGFGIFDSLIDQDEVSNRGETISAEEKIQTEEIPEEEPCIDQTYNDSETFAEPAPEDISQQASDDFEEAYSNEQTGEIEDSIDGESVENDDYIAGDDLDEEEDEDNVYEGEDDLTDEDDEEYVDEDDEDDENDESFVGDSQDRFFNEEDFEDENDDDVESGGLDKSPGVADEVSSIVGASEELDDYSDYLVGVPQDVPVGSEADVGAVSEEEVPEDYSDFILGVDDDRIDNADKNVASGTFDEIPEYTLTEVSPDEIRDVLEGRGLAEEVAKRRKELFASLEEIEPEPDVSEEWREYLKKKPESGLFDNFDE